MAAKGSCLEEAGGPDCLYVKPDDVRGMAGALLVAMNTQKTERVRRSQDYVKRFENHDVAAQVISVYGWVDPVFRVR